MTSVSHDARPSWLDMQLDAFTGPQRHAVTERTDYRAPAATCQQCGELTPDLTIGARGFALRMAARNHTAETGHAVTLTSAEKTTVFEVPTGGAPDPMGTLDMFADADR